MTIDFYEWYKKKLIRESEMPSANKIINNKVAKAHFQMLSGEEQNSIMHLYLEEDRNGRRSN